MELRFEKVLYEKQALLKAAYSFLDRVYFHLSQTEKEWIVIWKPKHGCELSSDEFENEMIHQQLRFQLVNESRDIRKILLGRAMASTLIEKPKEPAVSVGNDVAAKEILKGWFDE